jgi:hypothetical protein
MTWNNTLESLFLEIEEAVETETKELAFYAFTRLQEMSPVGNPSLWEKPQSAPAGYVGGTFRNSWQIDQEENRWVISNPQPYGPRLDDGHSEQAPDGLIDIVVADLGNLR